MAVSGISTFNGGLITTEFAEKCNDIGNGGTDAPKIENIELLTANSNLLDSADTYTYKGKFEG